jgi:hypothetical protein
MARSETASYRLETSWPVANVTRVGVLGFIPPDVDADLPMVVTVLLLPNKTNETPPLSEKEERARACGGPITLRITNVNSDGIEQNTDPKANPYTQAHKRKVVTKTGLMDDCVAAYSAAGGNVDNQCLAIADVLNLPANGILPAKHVA